MYSTCLFCNSNLGTNEVIEHFPVGRRLAFDAAKGRLWVVCKSCARWNLTPLEERWEAIEECERAFSATSLRMSTEHIGLARVSEGLELVRVGNPLRPEMAAWRYGDQFGRRRRKYYAYAAGVAVVGGALLIGGIEMGAFAGAGTQVFNMFNLGRQTVWGRRTVAHVATPDGVARVARGQLQTVRIMQSDSGETVLAFSRRLRQGERASSARTRWGVEMALRPVARRGLRTSIRGKRVEIPISQAMPALGALLPAINATGGSQRVVSDAVQLLDEHGTNSIMRTAVHVATNLPARRTTAAGSIAALPHEVRLALEMATHEDQERAAMEGELAALEQRWKEAEEVAAISDNMFLPTAVGEWISKMHLP